MRVEGGRVILGERACVCVGYPRTPPGRAAGRKPCERCGGSGNGPRGGRGGCNECMGLGRVADWDNLVDCAYCVGRGVVGETLTDCIEWEDFCRIPLRIVRQQRQQSWNEAYLALGYIWSSTDYGRAWEMSDGELARRIHERQGVGRVQACKVAAEDGTLCDGIAVLVHPQGYSLQALFAHKREGER